MSTTNDSDVTTHDDLAAVREAHSNAMMALAADVHPYSASAIRDWEEQLEAALARLAARLEETERAEHLCLTEEEGWRPCTPSLCQATDLLGEMLGLREELITRKVCLVAVRDDLKEISGAAVEDGGLWIRSVASARIEYVEQAIANTDAALIATGNPNVMDTMRPNRDATESALRELLALSRYGPTMNSEHVAEVARAAVIDGKETGPWAAS